MPKAIPTAAVVLMLCACASRPPIAGAYYQVPAVRIMTAWKRLPVGEPVHVLDDLAAEPGWLDRARIYSGLNFGRGCIDDSETGYTVFDISPDQKVDALPPPLFGGISIKVNGHVSPEELVAAIAQRKADVWIDEYALSFGVDDHQGLKHEFKHKHRRKMSDPFHLCDPKNSIHSPK